MIFNAREVARKIVIESGIIDATTTEENIVNAIELALIVCRKEVRKELYNQFINYIKHGEYCILTFWEEGEPTADGGYRMKYKGKWYQSKPVDETPKCDCGLDEILNGEEL